MALTPGARLGAYKNHSPNRSGRHGRGVVRCGCHSWSSSRDQGSARFLWSRSGSSGTIPARGAHPRVTEPSAHRADSRAGEVTQPGRWSWSWSTGRRWPTGSRRAPSRLTRRFPSRANPNMGGGTGTGDHSPQSGAREHQGQGRRHRHGDGLGSRRRWSPRVRCQRGSRSPLRSRHRP